MLASTSADICVSKAAGVSGMLPVKHIKSIEEFMSVHSFEAHLVLHCKCRGSICRKENACVTVASTAVEPGKLSGHGTIILI